MQKSLFRPASTNSSNSSELHAGSTGPVASPRDGQNAGVLRRPPTYAFKAFDRDGLKAFVGSELSIFTDAITWNLEVCAARQVLGAARV